MNHLIVGHFGGKNTGDEAMLSGLLTLIDKKDNVQIVTKRIEALSWVDEHIVVTEEAGHLNRFRHIKKSHDNVIFCGGTHFHDDYKPIRLIRHWVYLILQILLVSKAKMLGCRVLVIGNGFGPLKYWPTKILTKVFCAIADCVTVRDKSSSSELNNLGFTKHELQGDLALLNAYDKKQIHPSGVLGISVTNQSGYQRFLENSDYLNRLLTVIRSVAHQKSVSSIKIVVVRGGTVESDRPLSVELLSKLKNEGFSVELVEHSDNPSTAIEAIGSCSVFLGARFHSVLLSLLTEVPEIGIIPYHSKLNSLAADTKLLPNMIDIYKHPFVFDINYFNPKVESVTWDSLQSITEQSKGLVKKVIYAA